MTHLDDEQISGMEKSCRVNLVNSLTGYKSLHLLGTANNAGITNLCLVSSVFHLGSNPPLIGLVMRPEREHNDTLNNIRLTGHYTLNNVLPEWYRQAHQTSASYPSGVSEFDQCGFKKLYTRGFNAPFVQQATIRIGLCLREIIDLEINGTTIVIGEIVHALLDDQLIAKDGTIDHSSAGTMTVTGLDSYFSPEFVGRLAYAKPGELAAEINTESIKSNE